MSNTISPEEEEDVYAITPQEQEYDELYAKLEELVKLDSIRERMLKHMLDAIITHRAKWGFDEEQFALIFCEPVVRGKKKEKYKIIGIDGFGCLMVDSKNDDLNLKDWQWEELDNDTFRECAYEFCEAYAIAVTSVDGQGLNC